VAAGAAQVIGPTLLSSTVAITEQFTGSTQSITVTVAFGPATILCGPDQSITYFVPANTQNTNTQTFVDDVFLTSDHHEVAEAPESIPTLSEWGQIVRGALWLGDHELATDELDGLARLEDAQVDELLVLGSAEASGPRLVGRHHGNGVGSLRTRQCLRVDTPKICPTGSRRARALPV
jgi:hypothetical protein